MTEKPALDDFPRIVVACDPKGKGLVLDFETRCAVPLPGAQAAHFADVDYGAIEGRIVFHMLQRPEPERFRVIGNPTGRDHFDWAWHAEFEPKFKPKEPWKHAALSDFVNRIIEPELWSRTYGLTDYQGLNRLAATNNIDPLQKDDKPWAPPPPKTETALLTVQSALTRTSPTSSSTPITKTRRSTGRAASSKATISSSSTPKPISSWDRFDDWGSLFRPVTN